MKWFLLFTKRNFKKLSFLFILLLIPLMTLALTAVTDKDSGISRIGYTCTGTPESSTEEIFKALEKDDGILSFSYFESEEDGRQALSQADIDSLWILPEDLEAETERFYSKGGDPIITVLDRKDNEMSEMAREKLFCLIYPYLSYSIFKDYMTDSIPNADSLSEEELAEYYAYKGIDVEIAEVITVDGGGTAEEPKGNYLTTPLRGILAVTVMLSGLAAAAYTVTDRKRGLFAVFSPMKKKALCFASVLSSLVPTALVTLVSLHLAGLSDGILTEAVRMIPFILACAGLCSLFTAIFKTPEGLGTAIPVITVSSAVFSPVFMNTDAVPVIQWLFPTYHYLYSLSDTVHLTVLLGYGAVTFLIYLLIAKNG